MHKIIATVKSLHIHATFPNYKTKTINFITVNPQFNTSYLQINSFLIYWAMYLKLTLQISSIMCKLMFTKIQYTERCFLSPVNGELTVTLL